MAAQPASDYADTHITPVDIGSAQEACSAALGILRGLDTKVQKKLPIEPGPYELPFAVVADLQRFLKSSALVEEEQPSIQAWCLMFSIQISLYLRLLSTLTKSKTLRN